MASVEDALCHPPQDTSTLIDSLLRAMNAETILGPAKIHRQPLPTPSATFLSAAATIHLDVNDE